MPQTRTISLDLGNEDLPGNLLLAPIAEEAATGSAATSVVAS